MHRRIHYAEQDHNTGLLISLLSVVAKNEQMKTVLRLSVLVNIWTACERWDAWVWIALGGNRRFFVETENSLSSFIKGASYQTGEHC